MPIFGLPNHLANTVAVILDADGKGTTDAKEAAWRERGRELLIIFALHVYRDEQFADKSWGSVIRYLSDSSETIEHKLRAIAGQAEARNGKPGSVDWFLADLANDCSSMPPTELYAVLAETRSYLQGAESAIRDLPVIKDGEHWGGRGKGPGLAINAISWPTSLFVQDDKPQWFIATDLSDVREAYKNVSLGGQTTRDIVYGKNDLDTPGEPRATATDEDR